MTSKSFEFQESTNANESIVITAGTATPAAPPSSGRKLKRFNRSYSIPAVMVLAQEVVHPNGDDSLRSKNDKRHFWINHGRQIFNRTVDMLAKEA